VHQRRAEPQAPALPPAGRRRQEYREGKRAVMFFLSEEAFSEMHVLLALKGRKKVQQLMEELVDDWFRRENHPCQLRSLVAQQADDIDLGHS